MRRFELVAVATCSMAWCASARSQSSGMGSASVSWFDRGNTSGWVLAILAAVVLALVIGTFAWQRGKAAGPPASRGGTATAVLVGQSGQFSGTSIPVPPTGITLGRDSSGEGRLAFAETSDVSRRHCAIRYDVAMRRFKVIDFGSSNGTFLLPQEKKLSANQQVLCRSGQILRVGQDNVFELKSLD